MWLSWMCYDDSINTFSKNLGIWVFLTTYLLYILHKIDFEGRFLYKIRHAGPVCGARAHACKAT